MRSVNIFVFRQGWFWFLIWSGNFVEHLPLLDEKVKKSPCLQEDWCFISPFVFPGTP